MIKKERLYSQYKLKMLQNEPIRNIKVASNWLELSESKNKKEPKKKVSEKAWSCGDRENA
jgi:hypothetical protein